MGTLSAAAALFAAGLLGSAMLGLASLGTMPWYLSRASGLVAFAIITGSVILGLLLSTKRPKPLLPKGFSFDIHQFLAFFTLGLVAVHAGSLLFDHYIGYGVLDLLVPFRSPFERLSTGLGVIAFWGALAVTVSFSLRKRIGHRRWRQFHYVSFAVWVMALLHGLMAGTDAGLSLVRILYIGAGLSVGILLLLRIETARRTRPIPSQRRTGRSPAEPMRQR